MKYIIYNYCGTRKETIVDMTNYEALKGLGLKPEKVYMENGQMIVEVADYSNILNKREYQKLLEQYKKNGMIIKQTFLGGVSRGLTAAKMYDALGKEKYEKLYTDGAGAEAMSYVSSIGEPLALGLVLSNMPATSTSGKTGASNSEVAACFVAGTLVYGRENKKIEDLRVGDYVYSYNELTKQIEESKVLEIFVHDVNEILKIHLENGEIIRTTKEHPFYVGGEYVEAGELTAGMFLVGKDLDGIRIEDIKVQAEEVIRVYNIEVVGNHNYFVGESFVLVHNKNKIIDTAIKSPHGIDINVKTDGNAIIPKGKIESYMRGKVNVDYEKSMKEFKELKKFRNLNPKEFNLDPKNKMKLDKLGKQIHNYERSAAMARELEKIGLSDTLENNNKIYENLFGVSKNST